MARDVIIACDFSSRSETLAFLDLFTDCKPFVKIGMELYYAEGPDIVREIKRRGHRIFLDLKLHDIPNTVKKAMRVLSRLDVDMTNVHAAGTVEMMRAALEGLTRPDGSRPMLIAVTQLTSTSEELMQDELLVLLVGVGQQAVKVLALRHLLLGHRYQPFLASVATHFLFTRGFPSCLHSYYSTFSGGCQGVFLFFFGNSHYLLL